MLKSNNTPTTIVTFIAIICGTFFLTYFSYAVGFSNNLIVSIWPAAALTYWAVRKYGARAILPILIGGLTYNVLQSDRVSPAIYCIALVNAIAPWFAIKCERLFNKEPEEEHPFNKLSSTVGCLIGFGALSLFASIFGSILIFISFKIPTDNIPMLLFRWFLSDFTGCLILAPLFMTILKLQFNHKNISEYTSEILLVTLPLIGVYICSHMPGVDKLITFSITLIFVVPIIFWIACRDNTQRMTLYFTIISFGVFLISIYNSPDLNDTMWLSTQLAITLVLSGGYILHARQSEYNSLLAALESQVVERTAELQFTVNKLEEKNKEIAQASEELEDSLNTIQQTQNKLVETEKQAALGRLVAGVAHEINTPLGVSITYVSFLLEKYNQFYGDYKNGLFKKSSFESFCKQLDEALTGTAQNLTRTSELVKTFKMISTEQTSQVRREIDLYEYFDTGLESLKPKIKNTNIEIKLTSKNEVVVYTDPNIIFQVMTNIVTNSIVHAFKDNDEGLIEIILDRDDENVIMTFSDNGRGMNEEQLAHIFDPFYTTARNSGGTGLGSHIVYNLVTQALHGTIACKSTLKAGTIVTVAIPIR